MIKGVVIMLSRKYYIMIAKVIKDSRKNKHTLDRDQLLNDLCLELKRDNTLFNIDRFYNACND